MRAIFRYIEAIAKTNLPVLITGETGTGKELIANAIHKVSGRKGELVPVNVAGVDDNLFSDTLFGHKKGAFTGAEIERKRINRTCRRRNSFP
ncbi:MAG: sigma 54-interacting transcriptional regulator [Melioribacteraceae bacterium]|nr:sigma 54-interacting transcriptional regulator [Melioribacteraceae bacterium]